MVANLNNSQLVASNPFAAPGEKEGGSIISFLGRLVRRLKDWWSPSARCWRKLDKDTLEVDLDMPPKPPFPGAEVAWTMSGQTGKVLVQRSGGELCVKGTQVVLYVDSEQKDWSIQGYDLRDKLEGEWVLHPNVLDALCENPGFIPKSWQKVDAICFWAIGFHGPGNGSGRYVRKLYWSGFYEEWRSVCCSLGDRFDSRDPAAIRMRLWAE